MKNQSLKVLLVEDNPGDARLVRELLAQISGTEFDVQHYDLLGKGVAALSREDFDVVLLDLELPDSIGLETLNSILSTRTAAAVVVMTGRDNREIAADALRLGAQDFLVKGTQDPALLDRAIRYAFERKQIQTALTQSRDRFSRAAKRLSLLQKIGLTFNRETNMIKLMKTILDGVADITSSGLGKLILFADGGEEVLASFRADWFDEQTGEGDDSSSLLKTVSRLPELKTLLKDKNALRVDSPETLMPEDMEEPGNLGPILIGGLLNTRERLRGLIIAGKKRGGGEFTDEDEDIMSLLSAQASLALISTENFDREHTVAEALQSSLMPVKPSRKNLDIGMVYQSASSISHLGGDYCDFIEMDNGRIAIVIGDVCGKGLEAATSTAMVKYMLRAFLSIGMDAAECLTRLNNVIIQQLAPDKFVTLCLAILDPNEHRLTIAMAGHPPPLVMEGNNELKIKLTSLPLGVLPDYAYASETCSLVSGNIILYTDGLIEARPAGGEPFGRPNLLSALRATEALPAQLLAESLLEQAIVYSGGAIKDDIALLAVRLETGEK